MGMVAMVHAAIGALNAVEEGLSEALKSGDRECHDQLIVDALRGGKDADGIMLCQFTMAHLEERISRETGVATISSLRSALQKVAALLEQPVE